MLMKTILIADDDLPFLQLEEKHLMAAGYRVLCAREAYRALHLAVSASPDLMILDIHMPAGNGLSVQQRMRQLDIGTHIPIIYLTGDTSNGIKMEALEMGAEVLYKPFDLDLLTSKVEATLRRTVMRDPRLTAVMQCSSDAHWGDVARGLGSFFPEKRKVTG